MRVLGRSQRLSPLGRKKPHSLGQKPKEGGFNIFGFFKRAASFVLKGLKKVIVAAGNIAQDVLDVLNTFPFLKKIASFPIPIPGFGTLSVKTLLKGVATVGRITERLANAYEVYAKGGSFSDIVAELPITDLVLFVLSPIIESFQGVLAIARVPPTEAEKTIRKLAERLKGMIKQIPKPVRGGLIKGIEDKLGFRFPPDVKEALMKI